MARSTRRPEKFGAVFGRGFWSEAVAHDVFGDDAWDEEAEQVIATASFRSAAEHFKSAKRMPADHRPGARAIAINIHSYYLIFETVDISSTTRDKPTGEVVICVIGNFETLVQIASF